MCVKPYNVFLHLFWCNKYFCIYFGVTEIFYIYFGVTKIFYIYFGVTLHLPNL